jgi:hypothetical protein
MTTTMSSRSGCGTGYQGTMVHAPNENIRIADYWDAMRCIGGRAHQQAQR